MKCLYTFAQNKLFISNYKKRTTEVGKKFTNKMIDVFGSKIDEDSNCFADAFNRQAEIIKNRIIIGEDIHIKDNGPTFSMSGKGFSFNNKPCHDVIIFTI